MPLTPWSLPEQFDEYRLVRMLGRGSMGVVFLGHDLVLDRPVAIKFLSVVDANTRARERFLTEARAAARIQHPNVMAVYRVGELEGRLYIIGEYIRGISLSDLHRPVAAPEVLKIGVELARGLACAHRMGVLHRDIKLANAMRSESGEVKLLDFSLAKLLEASTADDDGAAEPALPTELEATLDPHSHMPRVTIDPGARGGRTVDATLTASPSRAPRSGPNPAARRAHSGPQPAPGPAQKAAAAPAPTPALDSTLTRVTAADAAVKVRVKMEESSDATVVGTPYYMAPELWRGEPASRTSDVYAVGVLLYILCSGHPPIEGSSTLELARLTQETVPRPLQSVAPWVDEQLAAIVDRCLRPPKDRYASGDELCSALEALTLGGAAATQAVRGNPYRGLQAFEARHRAVFFGRGAEIRAVTDRLRAEPFVLVAGDSGVGKSSLCRAGVLPMFTEQHQGERAWSTLSLMPGRRPLQTLVSALATSLSLQDPPLREMLEAEPAELVRTIARRQGKDHGIILFIDQLEELVTLADRHQLPAVGRFLAELASDLPGIRLLATVRGDFLTRVAALPGIGPRINAAIHLLTPLSREGVREAIVGPAAMQSVRFDSEALIEELVTAGAEGNLPLLQFALAELWEARDPKTREITAGDLERIGRVTGALARHADNVVDALPPAQRVAVRRLLMRLVTIEDTRASLPREDLVVGDQLQEAALEALVRGRLVVAREAQDGTVYEIAHEALIRSWGTLQRWTSEEREAREVRHRVEVAALEWQRLGSARAGLWTAAQLAETGVLEPGNLRPREQAFLAAARAELVRRRWSRRVLALAIPAALAFVYAAIRVQDARALARRVDEQVALAVATAEQARALAGEAHDLRRRSFAQFDAQDAAAGEQTWAQALARTGRSDAVYKQATQQLEGALGLDAGSSRARELLADVLFERALMTEAINKPEVAEELIERLKLYDDGTRQARWLAPAVVDIATQPAGAEISLGRYVLDDAQRLVVADERPLGTSPLTGTELPAGSYLFKFHAEGREPVLYPLRVERGERLAVTPTLPATGTIPAGFAYVPRSRFLFGSDDEEIIRSKFFLTAPQHAVETASFIIARHETTYAEYLEFLRDLPPEQRNARIPGAATDNLHIGVRLQELAGGRWHLTLAAGGVRYSAPEGQQLVYAGRARNAAQDWLQMPISAISTEDAAAYLSWLDAHGKLPGARFCTEWEWEHAVRGADGRSYPHGEQLGPHQANIDATYGKIMTTMGPDVGGLHPESRSPFGVDDAVGNVWEWTTSSFIPGELVTRGGAFFFEEVTCSSMNRFVPDPDLRDGTLGLRVCASWPDAP